MKRLTLLESRVEAWFSGFSYMFFPYQLRTDGSKRERVTLIFYLTNFGRGISQDSQYIPRNTNIYIFLPRPLGNFNIRISCKYYTMKNPYYIWK